MYICALCNQPRHHHDHGYYPTPFGGVCEECWQDIPESYQDDYTKAEVLANIADSQEAEHRAALAKEPTGAEIVADLIRLAKEYEAANPTQAGGLDLVPVTPYWYDCVNADGSPRRCRECGRLLTPDNTPDASSVCDACTNHGGY